MSALNSESDEVYFICEKIKEEDKKSPVYYTVESDDEESAEPSSVNLQDNNKTPIVDVDSEKWGKIEISNVVSLQNIENNDDEKLCMKIDTFSEDEGSESESGNDANIRVKRKFTAIEKSEGKTQNEQSEHTNDVAEDLGYKSPFDYLRQYCSNCLKIITRPKKKILRHCPNCITPLLFDCVVCHRKYKQVTNIYSHLKTKYDCRTKPDLHCPMCDYTNIHEGFMKNHMQKRHAGGLEDLISCSKCGRHFKRAYNAEEHELSCGGAPYLDCTFCDFRTTYRISFKIHKNHHIVDPAKGAALVNEKFEEVTIDPLSDSSTIWTPGISKATKNKIIKKSNNKESPESKDKIIDLYCRNMIKMYCYKCKVTTVVRVKKELNCTKCQTELLHQCGLCSSKFISYPNILRHFRAKHQHDKVKDTYVCGICDRTYESFKKLSRHENFCSRNLKCNLCPFTAKMPNVLKKHSLKWHLGPDSKFHNPCTRCGRQKRIFKGMEDVDYCGNCA